MDQPQLFSHSEFIAHAAETAVEGSTDKVRTVTYEYTVIVS
jgi:hypothetical protein